jgi:ADP-heptose:LPS heptosyltransferase
MLKKMARRIRIYLEGLDYLFAGCSARHPVGYAALRRERGLEPFRHVWWTQYTLEGYRTIRRAVSLLDWALAQPASTATGSEVLPHGGRLLIVRLGHLGDLLHLLPTVQEIRKQRPDVRLELVTGPWNRGLLEHSIFDAVHEYTPDLVQYHRGDRRGVRSPAEERDFIQSLSRERVDVVFCPSAPHLADLPLIIGLRPARYVGGDWKGLSVPVSFSRLTRPHDSRRYELDAVADYLPLMGLVRPEALSLKYVPAAASRQKVQSWCEEHKLQPGRLVVMAPGSGWPGKCWPAERFAQLADWLVGRYGVQVVLTGSPAERGLCELVRGHMRAQAGAAAGVFSIDESAALIERAALLVGNDSAPVHLAAAMNRPTISLWGPTFPEAWAPHGEAHRVVRSEQVCDGCTYWHPSAICTGRPPCMTTLSLAAVQAALETSPCSAGWVEAATKAPGNPS